MKKYRIARGVKAIEARSALEAAQIHSLASRNAFKVRKHISSISTMELRIMLSNCGYTPPTDDYDVRRECVDRFGQWYMVDVL